MKTLFLSMLAGGAVTACIALGGCASSGDDSPDSQPARPSATMVPPSTPESPSSPTAGSANGDPHGFVQ